MRHKGKRAGVQLSAPDPPWPTFLPSRRIPGNLLPREIGMPCLVRRLHGRRGAGRCVEVITAALPTCLLPTAGGDTRGELPREYDRHEGHRERSWSGWT